MELSVLLTPKAGFLPAQEEARALLEDPLGPTWVLLSGGQGAGKTYWLCWELARLHFTNLRHVVQQTPPGSPDRVNGMFVSPTYKLLKKVIFPAFDHVLTDVGLAGQYRWNRSDGILTFEFGGQFYFFTAEKPEMIVGVEVSEAGIDEPGTMRNFGEVVGRVINRLRGPGVLKKVASAGTPEDIVTRQDFYDFIASPEAQERYGERGTNKRRIVFASTRDNYFMDDLSGYVERQEEVLTKQQQLAYIEGHFVAFNMGRVYSGFIDRSFRNGGHTVPDDDEILKPPGRGNILCISLDFNVDPMCGVIFWVASDESILVCDEIRIPNAGGEGETPITRWCHEAISRWIGEWNGPVYVYGDATEKRRAVAASMTGWQQVHSTLQKVVVDKGWEYHNGVWGGNPREIDRVNSLNAAFEGRRILIANRCVHLRKDLNLVGFKEGTTEIDKSDKGLTHLSDALGYGWVQRSGLLARKPGDLLPKVITLPDVPVGDQWDWGTSG